MESIDDSIGDTLAGIIRRAVFVCVMATVTLSVTVFKSAPGSAQSGQQKVRTAKQLTHEDLVKRYPVVEFDEPDPSDFWVNTKLILLIPYESLSLMLGLNRR